MTDSWELMRGGDKEAFMRLYKSHYQALFSYGFRICSDRELTKDCLQEMFLELWNTRATLSREVKNVRAYLFTWLRRKISHELINLQKLTFPDQPEEIAEASYEELLIAFQLSEEKKERLRQALKKLTKKQLEIIRLKFFEGLSYRDIADQTALTPRTVYNVVYEALKLLKNAMQLVLILPLCN